MGNRPKVLVVSGCAGDAEVVSAYVKRHADDREWICCVSGPAEKVFARKGIPTLPIAAKDERALVQMESDTQSHKGNVSILDGHVVLTYGDRTLQADHIEYDSTTGEVILTGNLVVSGGENDESIHASLGTINVRTQVGRFYDVTGGRVTIDGIDVHDVTAASLRSQIGIVFPRCDNQSCLWRVMFLQHTRTFQIWMLEVGCWLLAVPRNPPASHLHAMPGPAQRA